jgi:putative FmdB family regulatory protein
MPLFEYVCKDCGKQFETLVFSSSNNSEIECPKCKSNNTEKKISVFSSSGNSGSNTSSSGSCSSRGGYFT